ncbi:regulator of G protein signaling superfamily [Meredithblackwellia eburnea MCA 4105]
MTTRGPPVPRNRLPTLAEVLRRSTRPPVDLYCYYLFLQREGAEDSLDFWLDVQQHENLCRAYFKDIRKSGRSVRDEWPRYADYARSHASIYGAVTGIRRGDDDGEEGEREVDAGRWGSESPSFGGGGFHPAGESSASGSGEKGEQWDRRETTGTFDTNDRLSADASRYTQRTPSPTSNGPAPAYPLSPTLKALYPHDDENRRGHKRTSTAAQPFIPRDAAISRTDLIASAERIYSRYLKRDAEKEIYLPSTLLMNEFPIQGPPLSIVTDPRYEHQADAEARVPDMFHFQKEYVYRSMEQDTFPRFLRAKAFGNLTPVSSLVRLGFGLLCLWIAFATAFSFIFLDSKPKAKRLWIILPFTFAIMNIVAHSYDLDPMMVFMGVSETTPFRTIGIREPYVRKLLFGRALWVTLFTAVLVAVLTVIFWAVPGHRL